MTLEKAMEQIRRYYAAALNLKHVRKPLAWALYQVWHEADKQGETAEKCDGSEKCGRFCANCNRRTNNDPNSSSCR